MLTGSRELQHECQLTFRVFQTVGLLTLGERVGEKQTAFLIMDKANSVTDTRWRLISGGRSVSPKARYCASVLLLHSFRRGGNRCLWPLMSQLGSKSEELLDFLRCRINHQIFTRNRKIFNPFPQRRMQTHFLYFSI